MEPLKKGSVMKGELKCVRRKRTEVTLDIHWSRNCVCLNPPVFSPDKSTELILEIRAGEGGDDSKLFVADLLSAYIKYAQSKNLHTEILATSVGSATLQVCGNGCWDVFQHEPGIHCIQRIPPTESKGRRQTSMLSVAVLPILDQKIEPLPDAEIEVKTQGGHGPGGQHQNKTDSAVRMTHVPTNTVVFINGRSQHQNKADALRILTAKVNEVRMMAAGCGVCGLEGLSNGFRRTRSKDSHLQFHQASGCGS